MEKANSVDSTWKYVITNPLKSVPRLDSIPWLGRKTGSDGELSSNRSSKRYTSCSAPPVSEAILLPIPRRADESESPVSVVKAGAGELEIAMKVRLKEKPRQKCTLLTLVWDEHASTCLPCIGIEATSLRLFAKLSVGSVTMDLKVPEVPLKVGFAMDVSFILTWGLEKASVQLRVGQESVATNCDQLRLPLSLGLNVYLGSGTYSNLPPAGCAQVDSLVFKSRCFQQEKSDIGWLIAFDMGPMERELLEEAEHAMMVLRAHGPFDIVFGVLVAINSVTIGLEVQYPSWPHWSLVNMLFLVLFSVELAVRLSFFGRRWYIGFFMDSWLIFDGFVVAVSLVDAFAVINVPFSPRIVRHIRLVKLARMLRLVRSFRVLGLLLEGMSKSAGLLVWICALMSCMAYIFALVIVGVTDGQEGVARAEFGEALPEWTDLASSMWVVAQMVSFDSWTVPIRAAMNLQSAIGYTIAGLMLVFVAFCGVGMLNMMVGVMSHVAFALDGKNRRSIGAEKMKAKETALRSFRQKLKDYGERPLFQNDRYISWPELIEAMTSDREVKQLMATMEVGSHEILDMDDMFEQNGQIEIDGLTAAIGTIILQRYFSSTSSELTDGGQGGILRPNDMLFLKAGLSELDKAVRQVDAEVASTCVLVFDVIKSLHQRADQAFTLLRAFSEDRWSVPRDWTKYHQNDGSSCRGSSRNQGVRTADIASHVDMVIMEQAEASLFSVFDIFFGVVLVSNGIFAGVHVSSPSDAKPFALVDMGFLLLYIFEFVFRAILFTHLVEARIDLDDGEVDAAPGQAREAAADILRLRARMLLGIVPPMPNSGCKGVVYCLPRFLKDKFVMFDLIIIILCVVDTAILWPVREASGASSARSLNTLSVMRIVRLLRLTRVLRIFRLFPQLQFLLRVFMDSFRAIVVVMAILVVALYIFSIFTYVAFEGATSAELNSYFGSLPSAAISGWQIVTFDRWRPIFESSADEYPLQTGCMAVVAMLLGMGLLKLATGLVAGSAISMVRKQAEEVRLADLHAFFSAMDSIEDMVKDALQNDMVPQELFESVLGIQFLPRRGPVIDEVAIKVARKRGSDKKFASEMMSAFMTAKLSPQIIKLIFEKIDAMGSGYISINMFTRGAGVFREDLSKVDVFASTVILREMKAKQTDVSAKLLTCQQTLDALIQDVAALIHRTSSKNGPSDSLPEIGSLSHAGEKAFLDLVDSSGTPGAQNAAGPIRLKPARGTITLKGELADGRGTDFREEIHTGDMLLLEYAKTSENHLEHVEPMLLVCVVKQVITSSRLKVSRVNHDLGNQSVPYMVITAEQGPDTSASKHLKSKVSKSLHQDTSLSPRSAHRLFEWEVWTRHQDRRQLRELMDERARLSQLQCSLERQREYLRNRSVIFTVFHGWRICVEERRGAVFRSSLKWQSRPLPLALQRTPRPGDGQHAPQIAGQIPLTSMAPSGMLETGSTAIPPESIARQSLIALSHGLGTTASRLAADENFTSSKESLSPPEPVAFTMQRDTGGAGGEVLPAPRLSPRVRYERSTRPSSPRPSPQQSPRPSVQSQHVPPPMSMPPLLMGGGSSGERRAPQSLQVPFGSPSFQPPTRPSQDLPRSLPMTLPPAPGRAPDSAGVA